MNHKKRQMPKSTHRKFAIQTPIFGIPLVFDILFFGILELLFCLLEFLSTKTFDFGLTNLLSPIILGILASVAFKAKLVIDQKGVYLLFTLFGWQFLLKSIEWNQIKRVEIGRFGSLVSGKILNVLHWGQQHFSQDRI
jgi:hypothetical protein